MPLRRGTRFPIEGTGTGRDGGAPVVLALERGRPAKRRFVLEEQAAASCQPSSISVRSPALLGSVSRGLIKPRSCPHRGGAAARPTTAYTPDYGATSTQGDAPALASVGRASRSGLAAVTSSTTCAVRTACSLSRPRGGRSGRAAYRSDARPGHQEGTRDEDPKPKDEGRNEEERE